jgi:hypothetical protein
MSSYAIAKYAAGTAAGLLIVSVIAFGGCEPTLQSEGSRCNPTLPSVGETDCNAGFACTQPPLCPENYCCPVDSTGDAAPSTNPYCQTGCAGGAASLCNAGVDDKGQCAFACANDPSDLANSTVCTSASDGGTDGGGSDATSDAAPADAGSGDAAIDAHEGGAEGGGSDGGGGDDGGADGAADGSAGDGAGDGGSDGASDASTD